MLLEAVISRAPAESSCGSRELHPFKRRYMVSSFHLLLGCVCGSPQNEFSSPKGYPRRMQRWTTPSLLCSFAHAQVLRRHHSFSYSFISVLIGPFSRGSPHFRYQEYRCTFRYQEYRSEQDR